MEVTPSALLFSCSSCFTSELSMLPILMHLSLIFAERSWLEQGRKLGEHVLPLARNFNNMTVDLESDGNTIVGDLSLSYIWILSSSKVCI